MSRLASWIVALNTLIFFSIDSPLIEGKSTFFEPSVIIIYLPLPKISFTNGMNSPTSARHAAWTIYISYLVISELFVSCIAHTNSNFSPENTRKKPLLLLNNEY